MTHDIILNDVEAELKRSDALHPDMHSAHEGWAVIYKELDELWELVRQNRAYSNAGYAESIQVAAMAVKFARMVFFRQEDRDQ